jgi:hypothetical protein
MARRTQKSLLGRPNTFTPRRCPPLALAAPLGVALIATSHRCFPTKAILAWHSTTVAERLRLIERYGEPTKRGTEELRDTAGEGLKDEVLDWAGRSVFIRIRCHTHADTTLGYISIGTGFTFPPNMPLR